MIWFYALWITLRATKKNRGARMAKIDHPHPGLGMG